MEHTKKLEIILASIFTLLFLAVAGAFAAYSYVNFKTPIKKVEFTQQGKDSVVVTVASSSPVKTRVEYGTSDLYLNATAPAEQFETTQTHVVWGLLPGKKHFFRVIAMDESGKSYTTKFYQF